MKQTSLRFRLTVLAFTSISLALIFTTYALNNRFYGYFEDRVRSEMRRNLEQLATNLSIDQANKIQISPLPDRRFQQPFSGLYWQVEVAGSEPQLSRSLWGKPIALSHDTQPGERFKGAAKSPTGEPVLVSGWTIFTGEGNTRQMVDLVVATDETEISTAAQGFRAYLIKWLGLMLLGLIAAAWLQINVGLAPLKLIKRKVELVKHGSESRLTGDFVTEVKPLVDEVNNLLEVHEDSLAKAREKVSDLAHGLKTPLTVMRAILAEVEGTIGRAKSQEIEEQISSMHSFIERELAQARNNVSSWNESPVGPVVEKIVASMKKLPRGADLDWEVKIPAGLTIPLDPHDLTELLGNLLDNSRKWAANKVAINGKILQGSAGLISIGDDGQGVPTTKMEWLTSRGQSGKNVEQGTGLGLAISEDLVRLIGGSVVFSRSSLGGLQVDVTWE